MKESRIEIQVGIALVAALFILVSGLMWFQEYQIGEEYQEITVLFPTVGGLGAGDPVRVRGISMGRVTEVALHPEGVQVRLRLQDEVELRDDADFLLASAGIMGERMITVEPGQGTPLADLSQRTFQGRYELAMTEMMGELQAFNVRVMQVLARADSVLGQLQDDQALARTLESTRQAAETATAVLKDNRESITQASSSLADVATRFQRFLDEHEEELGQGVDGLARNAAALDTLLADLGEVVGGTQDVLTALKEQKGTAGRLIYDETLAASVVESIDRLRFLLEDLQLNPQRYLTVRIF